MEHAPAVPAPERLHALDAARGFALLLGIVLHATMSFFFFLPTMDVSRSTTLGVLFYGIHVFRMTLFYLIAGFFAHLVFHRRGTRMFIKDRAKRILVPMIVGWLVLAPPTIGVVAWGLGRAFPNGAPDGAYVAPDGFPLLHLWFLYYLCVFYLVTLVVRQLLVATVDRGGRLRTGIDAILRGILPSYLAPLFLALPLFAVLYFDPKWLVWFGLTSPDTGFMPKLSAMVGFGLAFGFGWVLHRQVMLLETWRRQWAVNLVIAVSLTTLCVVLVGPIPSVDASVVPGPAWHRLAYAVSYTTSMWYWTFGLIGAALRFCSGPSARRRYLADSAYWLYLVHLPVIFALQVLMMNWPLSWVIKFPLILVVALAVLLLSYHYLVRSTLIGEILNGHRYPRHKRVATSRAPELVARVPAVGGDMIPVAQLSGVTKKYGKAIALDDLTLAVRPGELLAVLGPNGAGKTTAIGLWLGTLEPDSGVVSVMGGSPFEVQNRLGVGVMMQEVSFAPMLSTREVIALTASYYRDPLPVAQVLALTGTESLADRRYGKLSAGQKRQVQFAAAMCGRPSLLFLDEPTVGLDVQAREAMWRSIRRLLGEGCSIVLTTHYLEEAEALADRVVVLAKGKLVAEGSVDEMRALVTRKRISCASTIDVEEVRQWAGVVDATREGQLVQVTAFDAEAIVRRLLAADQSLSHLEVKQASLAQAFTELTREAA